jgi:hypothetical protein
LETAAAWEKEGIAHGEIRPVIGAVDETFLQRMMLVFMDLATGYVLVEEVAADRSYDTWFDRTNHNPIEHRVFPHITRACQGVIFHTVDIARQFIAHAKTTPGLRVTVRILGKGYQTGRKYTADFKQNMKIIFDDHLPKWNYRAVPACT